jgi:hypothetical protein
MCLGEQNNDGLGVKLPLTMSSRDVLDDDRSLNKAAVEHGVAKELIAQLQSMDVFDPLFDATVTVLGEYVNHHIEEENEIFPKVEKSEDGL